MHAHGALSRADRLMLACARVGLDDRTRHEIEELVQDGIDWETILKRSKEEGISALLYVHLKELQSVRLQVPPAILSRLGAIYQGNWARNSVLMERWSELMTLLGQAGVEGITLKGMALIHTVYPEIGLRSMADIDLLIRLADLPAVKRTLQTVGYRCPDGEMEAEEAFRCYLHFVRDGTVIDLHWELAHYTRFEGIVQVDHDGLWRLARSVAIDKTSGLVLSPEDMLLHLALHLTLGSEFGRLIWFTDIDVMLRRCGLGFDWERVLEEASLWRVKVLLGYTLRVCQESFGTPIPPGVLPRLLPGRLRLAVLGACIGIRWPPSLSGQLGDSKIYLAETLIMDRIRHVFQVLWNSLFPSRAWVKFHYALTSRWQITAYQALHPFRVGYLAVKHLR